MEETLERWRAIKRAASTVILAEGATITHHHGVGLLKAPWMKDEHGPLIEMYHAVKRALDPNNILNPGKLVP